MTLCWASKLSANGIVKSSCKARAAQMERERRVQTETSVPTSGVRKVIVIGIDLRIKRAKGKRPVSMTVTEKTKSAE